jgi:hypothetical protein
LEETECPQNSDKGGGNADKKAEQTAGYPRPSSNSRASNIKNHDPEAPQNASNRRRQNRFWDFSFSTVTQFLAAVVLAGIGYLQYTVYVRQAGIYERQADIMDTQGKISKEQEKIMKGQLGEMILDQRPWIKLIAIKPNSDLLFDKDDVLFDIQVVVKNVGKTPANRVFVEPYFFFPHIDSINASDELDKKCERLKEERFTRQFANLIFPTDDATYPVGIMRPIKDTKEATKMGLHVSFEVIGCIMYEFPFDTVLHQTRFMFHLERKDHPGWDFIGTRGGVVPKSELLLVPEDYAPYAD